MIIRSIVFLIMLAALGGCAAPLTYVPKDAPASVAAPQVKVGDYWEYSVRDGYTGFARGTYRYEVSRVDADQVVVDVTRDGLRVDAFIYAPGWNGRELPLTNLQRFRYEPVLISYAYPLGAGKTWHTVARSTDPATGKTYSTHTQGKVLGWERIKVPAGEFDALKIQRYVFAGNMENFRTQEDISETDWYAPSVRRAVRTEGSSQHLDTSRSGGNGEDGGPLLVRGDWLIAELLRYGSR